MRRFSRILATVSITAAIVTSLIGGAGGVMISPALAQNTPQGLYELPTLSPEFNLEGYAVETETISRTAENLKDISFRISLPKTWVERSALGQDYGELFRFEGPAIGDVRPHFSFRREQMNRENTAKNELIAYMLKSRYILRALNEVDDRTAEAFYVKLDHNGDSFAVRARVRVQGSSLLISEYAIPVASWPEKSDEQIFAIQSFKFLQSNDEQVERRVRRVYHDTVSLHYPASWVFVSEKAEGDNGVVMQLQNSTQQGAKDGDLRLSMYSGRHLTMPTSHERYTVDVPSLLRDIKTRYEQERLVVGEAIEKRPIALDLPVKFISLDVYAVRPRITDYQTQRQETITHELWVALFQTEEDYPRTFLVELLTPARAQNVYVWSVNTRALELILKSIN